MGDIDSTDIAAMTRRIRELDQMIEEARIANLASVARRRYPGVAGVILTPPAATALDRLNPHLWERGGDLRRIERLNGDAWPWDRILLGTGEVLVDEERADAIATLFEDVGAYPIATVDGILEELSTEDVLERVGWPPLATVSSDEAVHDARARETESIRDSYESARDSSARDLWVLLDIREQEDPHDLETLTAERDGLVADLRRTATAHLIRQVQAQFPNVVSLVVARPPSYPDKAELLTVTDRDGDVLEPRDQVGGPLRFDALGGVGFHGERTPLEPFAVFSTLTGESFSECESITIMNGAE